MKGQLMCIEVEKLSGVRFIPEFPCGIRRKLDFCLLSSPSMFYFSTFWSVSSENISLINHLHANLLSGSTFWWSKLRHSEKKLLGFWSGLCWLCRSDSGELTKLQYWVFQSMNIVYSSIWATVLSLSNVLKNLYIEKYNFFC